MTKLNNKKAPGELHTMPFIISVTALLMGWIKRLSGCCLVQILQFADV
jgi:hypothetical protein